MGSDERISSRFRIFFGKDVDETRYYALRCEGTDLSRSSMEADGGYNTRPVLKSIRVSTRGGSSGMVMLWATGGKCPTAKSAISYNFASTLSNSYFQTKGKLTLVRAASEVHFLSL